MVITPYPLPHGFNIIAKPWVQLNAIDHHGKRLGKNFTCKRVGKSSSPLSDRDLVINTITRKQNHFGNESNMMLPSDPNPNYKWSIQACWGDFWTNKRIFWTFLWHATFPINLGHSGLLIYSPHQLLFHLPCGNSPLFNSNQQEN